MYIYIYIYTLTHIERERDAPRRRFALRGELVPLVRSPLTRQHIDAKPAALLRAMRHGTAERDAGDYSSVQVTGDTDLSSGSKRHEPSHINTV